MKRTVFERVSEFVESRPESKNSLAGLCGMSAQTFGRYVNGENKVTVSLIESLLRAFPNLSSDWLIRGEGPMYIDDLPDDDDTDQVLDLKAEITRLRAERDELRKGVEELRKGVEPLRQEVIELRAINRYQEKRLDKLAGILREEPQLSIAAEKRTDYITNPIIEELL